MEHYPAAELGKEALHLPAGLDDVVVEDDVDPHRVTVIGHELPEQLAEEIAGLGLHRHPGQLNVRGVAVAGDEPRCPFGIQSLRSSG